MELMVIDSIYGLENSTRSAIFNTQRAGRAGELSSYGIGSSNHSLRSYDAPISSKLSLNLTSFPHSLRNLLPNEGRRQRRRRRILQCGSMEDASKEPKSQSPAAALRRLLASPGILLGPACHDALSAKLVEEAGFRVAFMSGFSVAAVRLGLSDTGLISYGEMVDQGRLITSAVSIPVIGDGDNGYGNALNVKRTVKGYIQAGFAGILIEDQVSPKACGHTQGRKVVSREEATSRIVAASDARKETQAEFVIIARTDAFQAVSLEEALWRVKAFAEAGADVLFIDALSSTEEMLAFCKVCPNIPKMANMLEGGRTPLLTPLELQNIGFKIVAYPLSLLAVSIRAMQDALLALKSGRFPRPGSLASFDEIKATLGFDDYYKMEARYAFTANIASVEAASEAQNVEGASHFREAQTEVDNRTLDSVPEQPKGQPGAESAGSSEANDQQQPPKETESVYVFSEVIENSFKSDQQNSLPSIWSRMLRVKITNSSGIVKLDIRIPAGFLDGLSKVFPGFNIGSLVNEAASKTDGNFESGRKLVDIVNRGGDRLEVFIE